MSMNRWTGAGEIYRTKPTKKFPKGIRVQKATDQYDAPQGSVAVVVVKDGHMFWVKEKELTKE